jgi:hypothetical protein
MARTSFLNESREQLLSITEEAYNEPIRLVARKAWERQVRSDNPQWQYLTSKAFYLDDTTGRAHVLAMVDKRLPGIGLVGYFACTSAKAGARILERAAEWLESEFGLKRVYGPINGTLPNDYRLNLRDDFVFPGEPVNPVWHIKAFEQAGFEVFNKYESSTAPVWLLKLIMITRRPKTEGRPMSVRSFDASHFDRDFRIYHELRNDIFPFQSIYCPAISLDERIYNSPGKFDPRYAFFLMGADREVGFTMAYPYEGKLVIKTMGIIKEYRGKNLSSMLFKPLHESAKEDGLRSVVFGMVRVGNQADRALRPVVRIFRHYVTMEKRI